MKTTITYFSSLIFLKLSVDLTYSGIHCPQLDEDLSFEGMFHEAGLCELTEEEEDSICYDPAA